MRDGSPAAIDAAVLVRPLVRAGTGAVEDEEAVSSRELAVPTMSVDVTAPCRPVRADAVPACDPGR